MRGLAVASSSFWSLTRDIPACARIWAASCRSACIASEYPRLRGNQASASSRLTLKRSIPACAGTRRAPARARRTRPEHPRLRGDRVWLRHGVMHKHGASPPARGPGRKLHVLPNGARSIPACAGTGAARTDGPPLAAEHPRLRGDRTICKCSPALTNSPVKDRTGLPAPFPGRHRRNPIPPRARMRSAEAHRSRVHHSEPRRRHRSRHRHCPPKTAHSAPDPDAQAEPGRLLDRGQDPEQIPGIRIDVGFEHML